MRKLILSPGLEASCGSCGGSSSLRYLSWLTAMVPGSALMIMSLFVESETTELSFNVVGFLLMLIIPFLFAPLHAED